MKKPPSTCPVCGTQEQVIIDISTKVHFHICPGLKAEIFWIGSFFSTDPNKLPVLLTT